MPHYLDLSVAFQYDFVITYLAVVFFIQWMLVNLRLKRFSNILRRVWESRNRQIHRRRAWPIQSEPTKKG